LRAVILAAGKGVRLLPLTENRSKHMIPVGGRPLILHLIDAFIHNGVREFTIVVGYKGEIIKSYLSDGQNLGITIKYVNQHKALGTADAVGLVKDQIEESRFLLCHGDLYISPDAIKQMMSAFNDRSLEAAVSVVAVKNQNQYGLVQTEDGYVKDIIEKPKQPVPEGLANAGIYFFGKSIFDAVKTTRRSIRGEYELTDSILKIVRHGGRVGSIPIEPEYWLDIGAPWDLLDANERALKTLKPDRSGNTENTAVIEGPVILQSGAKILSGARIEGPAYVGEGSIIGPNCYVRPYTSIGQNVRVGNGCELKNCIIMKDTKIPHQSYIGDSIIGERCNVGAGTITGNLRLDHRSIRMRIKGKAIDSGRKKLGAIIGDDVSTGINVNLMPGVKIGTGAQIGPGVTLYRDLPTGVKVLRQTTTVQKPQSRQARRI